MKAKCFNVSNWHFHVAGNANHRKSCAQSSTYVYVCIYIYIYVCVCARCLSTRTWRHYHTPILGRERERERRGKKRKMDVHPGPIYLKKYTLTIHRHVFFCSYNDVVWYAVHKQTSHKEYIYIYIPISISPYCLWYPNQMPSWAPRTRPRSCAE